MMLQRTVGHPSPDGAPPALVPDDGFGADGPACWGLDRGRPLTAPDDENEPEVPQDVIFVGDQGAAS